MTDLCRKWTITSAVVLTLIGFGLSIAAILTPSWQVVNLREYNSIHEHGLWLDCTRHSRDQNVLLRRYATITEPLHCVYKFDYDKYSGTFDIEDDNSPVGEVNRHKFYGWHTSTLILLALALITSFTSVCIGICGCCYSSLSIVFTAITLLTTFLSSIAEGLFFFYSHRADNRFIKGIVGTYEQRVGLAFFLQMAACFFHFVAFLVAMLSTYFAFTSKGATLDRYSLQHSSKTNMTNVGRANKDMPVAASSTQFDTNVAENFPLLLAPPAPPSFHSRAGSAYADNGTTNSNGWGVIGGGYRRNQNSTAPSPGSYYADGMRSDHPKDIVEESVETSTIFRSMEFEHPVFVQNPHANKPMRPPYYSSKADEFDRAVADSMPELAHARSYQSDILPGRIRRKSETCV
ncbi:clc-like domain-containing protein [Ditylenchus destructor]|nr:clc-like domain-containing protein [Ditylenchus destructor]